MAILFASSVCVFAWGVCSPLWLSGEGLEHPWAGGVALLMMWTPAVAVLLIWRVERRADFVAMLGMRLGGRGWWKYWLVAWLGVPLFCVAAPFVAAALGLYELDLDEFSGFRSLLRSAGGATALDQFSVESLIGIQLLGILAAPLLNAPLTLGEEIGWRGYLLPELMKFGQTRALLISGAVWGVWHAPLILLGHNYPDAPVLGAFLMIGFCVLFGVVFGWLRLISGSVWPAVIAHAALNGSSGVMFLFHADGAVSNSVYTGITGLSGWILPCCFVAFLYHTNQLPVSESVLGCARSGPTSRAQDHGLCTRE